MSNYSNEISKISILSDAETEELFRNMKKGDQEARNKLIKHNLRLVLSIANNYKDSINIPFDDLINIGAIGLIKAIDNYDIDRKTKLSTVAYSYIENFYKLYLRNIKSKKRDYSNDVSLQEVVYKDNDGNDITMEDFIEDDGINVDDKVINSILNEQLLEILDKLPKGYKEILFLRYGIKDGRNYSLEKIGKMKKVSRQSISQAEIRALKKIKSKETSMLIKDLLEK